MRNLKMALIALFILAVGVSTVFADLESAPVTPHLYYTWWTLLHNYIRYGDFEMQNRTFGVDSVFTIKTYNDGPLKGLALLQSQVDSTEVTDDDYFEIAGDMVPDAGTTKTRFFSLYVTNTDVSDGSEDAKVEIKTQAAGTLTTGITIEGDDATVADDLTVTDDAGIGGDLSVTGAAEIDGDITLENDETISNGTDGYITYSGILDKSDDNGATLASSGAAMTAVNVVDGMNKTTVTFDSLAVVITDADANGAHGTAKIHDFPEGVISFLGSVLNLSVAAAYGGIADDATYDIGIGTAVTGTDNEELATTEQDLVNKVEGDLAAGIATVAGYNATAAGHDGHTTEKDANLNIAIMAADCSANDTLWVSGSATLIWLNLGDY